MIFFPLLAAQKNICISSACLCVRPALIIDNTLPKFYEFQQLLALSPLAISISPVKFHFLIPTNKTRLFFSSSRFTLNHIPLCIKRRAIKSHKIKKFRLNAEEKTFFQFLVPLYPVFLIFMPKDGNRVTRSILVYITLPRIVVTRGSSK